MRPFILSALCLLVLLLDVYTFKALLRLFKNSRPAVKKYFSYAWWTLNLLLIGGVFLAIFANIFLSARAIILVAFFLLTVGKLFMLPFLLIDDLRTGILKLRRKRAPQAPKTATTSNSPDAETISRSSFLVKAGLIAAAIPLSSLSWGIVSGAYDYRVRRQKLLLPGLPASFDGITIAQISDIHSGSFYHKKSVLGGIELLLHQKPDMIFFTGDLVNNVASEMRHYQDIFSKLTAPLGVYSVLGNHDYGDYYFGKEPSPARQRNLQQLIKTHELMGWDLLLNEHRRIKVNGEEIGVLGVENWGMGRFPKYGKMEQAYQQTADLPVKLLLSHDPSHWRNEIIPHYQDIDVMFSGHTHGMQFGVRLDHFQWSPVQYIYKEWAGLYQEKQQQLYVNAGYGFLGYPGRVGILPEITIFELKRS